ncbi:MAG: hypothetical protein VB066_01810 [Paludibacter sp.]|nr:hypothetical protein [Paludibacter sp.]
MATIQQILNKIKDMAGRTGLFAIGKGEFFDTMTDITNKMSEINDNVNSVAKSLIWQDSVVNIVSTLPTSGLTIGQRYILTTDKKIYTATSTTAFDAGTSPDAGWAVKNQADGYIHSYNDTGWKNTGLKSFPEEVVLSSVQLLNDAKKKQARENIGALSIDQYKLNTPALIKDSRFDRVVDIWAATPNVIGEKFKITTCIKGGNVAIKHDTLGLFLVASTKTTGLEYLKLKNGANTHYIILVVNWDIDVPDSYDPLGSTDSVTADTPRTHYLKNIYNQIINKQYAANGNIVYNGDEIIQSCNIRYSNGASGTLVNSVYDNNILEYKTTTLTYTDSEIGSITITQSREFNEMGNIISESLISITF